MFKGRSSYEFVDGKKLMDVPRQEVRDVTKGKMSTLREVEEEYLNGWSATDNPDDYYRAFQEVAQTELKKDGFQGAFWTSEDDLTPKQYQIWDRSIIKDRKTGS